MREIHITDNNGTVILARSFSSSLLLTTEESLVLLNNILSKKIDKLYDLEDSIKLVIGDIEIFIDSLNPFKKHESELDKKLNELAIKVSNYNSAEIIKVLKERPVRATVNRTKSEKMSKRAVALALTGAISASALIGVGAISSIKNKNKKQASQKEETNIESVSVLPQTTKNTIEDKIIIEEPKVVEEQIHQEETPATNQIENTTEDNSITLPFEYADEGKKMSTVTYLGDIIDYYAKRYGISSDIVLSQITQERPLIENEHVINPCQLTNFVGVEFSVPVYNSDGVTQEVDTFKVTQEMIDDTDTNIKIGVAYLRYCIDKNDSLITGLFCYNQGPYSLSVACDFYNLNIDNYKKDINAIKARDLINRYFALRSACKYYGYDMNEYKGKEKEELALVQKYQSEAEKVVAHGDPKYLENVFRYMSNEDRSNSKIQYFMGNEKRTVAINNTLEYTNNLGGR